MPKQITFPLHEAPASMPAKSCDVLVFADNGAGIYHVSNVRYSHKHKTFCCGDEEPKKAAQERRKVWHDIKYWAYMSDVIEAMIATCNATEIAT